MATTARPKAVLYRMVMPSHVCPFGLKSKWQLERHGYDLEDHWLRTRDVLEAFKAKHQVKTTPQTFVAGERVGGNDDLTRFFGGHVPGKDETSYRPVVAVFAMTALMAMAASVAAFGTALTGQAGMWFVSLSMAVLAILKLQDVERFSTMFLTTTCSAAAGCPMPISTRSARLWRAC